MSHRIELVTEGGKAVLTWFCPGCKYYHKVLVGPGWRPEITWGWDGSLEMPTITPSVHCSGQITCHCFVEMGRIRFLSDSMHHLAGQTVDLDVVEDQDRITNLEVLAKLRAAGVHI